jgi:hypothetical protein
MKDIIHPDYFDYCKEKWEELLEGIAGAAMNIKN